MMNYNSKLAIAICTFSFLSLWILMSNSSGCGSGNTIDPPNTPAVFGEIHCNTGEYLCDWGFPLYLTKIFGNGLFRAETVATDASYVANELHNQTSGLIDCVVKSGCCLLHGFPETGNYVLTLYYFELGTATSCAPPIPNNCYRWRYMSEYESGYIPNCVFDSFSIFHEDPNGFVGPCF